jgi:hypothetical protein
VTTHLHDAALVWMGQVASAAHAKKPHMAPFPVADFDGCSLVPDLVMACCYMHDVGCHFSETADERRRVDAAFRDCIIAKAESEGPAWRWLWHALAWIAWVGVRLYGRRASSKRRWRPRR